MVKMPPSHTQPLDRKGKVEASKNGMYDTVSIELSLPKKHLRRLIATARSLNVPLSDLVSIYCTVLTTEKPRALKQMWLQILAQHKDIEKYWDIRLPRTRGSRGSNLPNK
jgi:hypothetical protein